MRCRSSDLSNEELPLDSIACWQRANQFLRNDSPRPLIFLKAESVKPFPHGREFITMIAERSSGFGGWPSPRCPITSRLLVGRCTLGAHGTACSSPESLGRRQGPSRPVL